MDIILTPNPLRIKRGAVVGTITSLPYGAAVNVTVDFTPPAIDTGSGRFFAPTQGNILNSLLITPHRINLVKIVDNSPGSDPDTLVIYLKSASNAPLQTSKGVIACIITSDESDAYLASVGLSKITSDAAFPRGTAPSNVVLLQNLDLVIVNTLIIPDNSDPVINLDASTVLYDLEIAGGIPTGSITIDKTLLPVGADVTPTTFSWADDPSDKTITLTFTVAPNTSQGSGVLGVTIPDPTTPTNPPIDARNISVVVNIPCATYSVDDTPNVPTYLVEPVSPVCP